MDQEHLIVLNLLVASLVVLKRSLYPVYPKSNQNTQHSGIKSLQLARLVIYNLDDNLPPSLPPSQRTQRPRHALQPDEALILERRPAVLALSHELKDAPPHDVHSLGLEIRILSPVQPDQADILQQHPVQGDLLDRPRGEADDEQARVPRDALETRLDHPDGVVDDVHPRPAIPGAVLRTELLDLLRPAPVPVVDDIVRAKVPRDPPLPLRPRGCDDRRALGLCDLHRRETHPARGRVDKDPVPPLDVGAVDESAVGRGRRDEEARSVLEAPSVRDGEERGLRGEDVRGVGALGRAEDAVTGLEARVGDRGRCCQDCAGEFHPRDPGQGRLVLVLALDLEQVEEVGPRGVDLDQVFVWGRGGGGEGGDGEIQWALQSSVVSYLSEVVVAGYIYLQGGKKYKERKKEKPYLDILANLNRPHLALSRERYSASRDQQHSTNSNNNSRSLAS